MSKGKTVKRETTLHVWARILDVCVSGCVDEAAVCYNVISGVCRQAGGGLGCLGGTRGCFSVRKIKEEEKDKKKRNSHLRYYDYCCSSC